MQELLNNNASAHVGRTDLQELHRPRRNDSDVLRETHRESPTTDAEFNKFHNKIVKDIEKNSNVVDKHFDKGNSFELFDSKKLDKSASINDGKKLDKDKSVDLNNKKDLEKANDLCDQKRKDKDKSVEADGGKKDKSIDLNDGKIKLPENVVKDKIGQASRSENSVDVSRQRERYQPNLSH